MAQTIQIYGVICSPMLLAICICLVVLARRPNQPDRGRAFVHAVVLIVVPLLLIAMLYLLGTIFPPE
jgi:hypothetical protein